MFSNLIETAAEATGLAHVADGANNKSLSSPDSSTSSLSCDSTESSSVSKDSDNDSDYHHIPTFAYDTGATGSYASKRTPLEHSRPTRRKIGGIGGITITATREGRCKAIPNVATSKGISRNLASVSQLTRHYKNAMTFDDKHAYAIPPHLHPIDGADIVGDITSNGLYNMHMKKFEQHVKKHKLPTSSAGEAALHTSIDVTNKGYKSSYDFLSEFPCLDDYLHYNEEAHPVADYHPADNAMLLHTRLGHAPKRVMILCLKNGINMGVHITVDELTNANIYCKACATSHINRKPFPKKSAREAHKTILGLIHTDTAGPRPKSLVYQDRNLHLQGKSKYWQIYVDDHTKYMWHNFLTKKSHLPSKMRAMRRQMELDARDSYQNPPAGQQRLRVQAYRSDNAGELTSKEAVRKLLKAMIDHERTVPGSSQQNAHAEAAIKIVQDMARTLLDSAKLPLIYWPFAITCAVYVINRLPSTTNPDNKSRYEMFYHKKPDLSRLKTFGSVVTKFLPIKKRKHGDKQSPSGEGGGRYRLIGYPRKTKGYEVLDIEKTPHPLVSVCRHIHLQENVEEFPSCSDDSDSSNTSDSSSISTTSSSISFGNLSDSDSTSESEMSPAEASTETSQSDSAPLDAKSDIEYEGSSNSDSSSILSNDNSQRKVVKSKPRDTVNKMAKRHNCDVRLLCHVNHGVADPSNPKSELQPTDHLRKGTELFLPTLSDEENFRLETESDLDDTGQDSDSSSSTSKSTPPSDHENEESKDNSPSQDQESKAKPDSDDHPIYFENEQHWPDHEKGQTRSGKHFGKPPTSTSDSDASPSDHSDKDECQEAYSCLAMELDIAEEAYNMEMAAAYAATPPLEASESTEKHLEDCLSTIKEAFVAINSIRKTSPKGVKKATKKILNKYRPKAYNTFVNAYITEEAHLVDSLRHLQARDIPTPKNYNQAIESAFQEYWNEAIAQEIANLNTYGVYRFEKLPPGCRPVNSHYIFKIKANLKGQVDRFKARLVAEGFRQRFGIEYIKTHASVCKMQTFRAQMAHCAEHDLLHEIIDVKSAYLEAYMDPKIPVYINIPGQPAPEGMAARLLKSLYGTRQAGHNWHETIVPLLIKWGFVKSPADPCCFLHQTADNDYCILCLFVDDFSITSTRKSTKSRDKFFKNLNKEYNTSIADDKDVYLGIRCRRLAPHAMFLDQEPYVEDFLHMYGFTDLRPTSTPTSGLQLYKDQQPMEQSEKDAMSKHPYRHVIGSLRYLEQCTRPDISFALNRLSRYQANPGLPHWQELKHLCRYVSGTKSHGIMYGKGVYPMHKELQHDLSGPLQCFVDSDHAADKETRRSCTGYIFFSRGGPISWRSRLQNSTSLSTTEAEFQAASDAGCENIWLRRLLSEYNELAATRINGLLVPKDFEAPKMTQQFFDTEVPTMFHEDNVGCIKCSEDPVLHGRMKHIDIKYHKIKEFVADKTAKLIYVSTHRQIADLLTKSLTKATFQRLRDCMVIDPFHSDFGNYIKNP